MTRMAALSRHGIRTHSMWRTEVAGSDPACSSDARQRLPIPVSPTERIQHASGLGDDPVLFTAGQQTNCRINALADAALVAGFELAIWFRETSPEDAPGEEAARKSHWGEARVESSPGTTGNLTRSSALRTSVVRHWFGRL